MDDVLDTGTLVKLKKIVADSLRLIGSDVLNNIFVAPELRDKGDVLKNRSYLEQAELLGRQFFCLIFTYLVDESVDHL